MLTTKDLTAGTPSMFASSKKFSLFHNELDENKREEITIIDDFMVEVGLGPDLRSVSATIQDAVKSIPSAGGESFPEFVFVNGEPIFLTGIGSYSWDEEGRIPVRLTTPYIKKFGNIRVHIPGLPSAQKSESETIKPLAKIAKPKIKSKATLEAKPLPESTGKSVKATAPLSRKINANSDLASPSTSNLKRQGLKGFRLAHFGMDISQVKKAILEDFNIGELMMDISENPEKTLTITSDKLLPVGGKATVQYFFSSATNKLTHVIITWGPTEKVKHIAKELLQLFSGISFLENHAQNTDETNHSIIYFGRDSYGNGIKLYWGANQKDVEGQSLKLSYLGFSP